MSKAVVEDREPVLLVDDDPVARVLTASVLETHGLEVIDVESGEEAMARFEALAPRCVVLDALMPGLDGFETCRRLRCLPGGAHVPILMLTGLEDEESVAHAYEVGATDFFVKSQQWTLLAQRVRYLLRSSRMRVELEKSRARLAKAQALARLGNWDWDLRSRTISASAEVFRLIDMPAREGRFADDLLLERLIPEDRPLLDEVVRRIMHTRQPQTAELRLRHPNGRVLTVQCEGEVDLEEDGRVTRISGTAQDISQRKEAELQIRALADFDPLTKLPNRRLFSERFARAIEDAGAHGRTLAILFIDLDRFKHINDTQGHTGGDALLIDVAQRLQTGVRLERNGDRPDDIVARLGGDEFVVMLGQLLPQDDPVRVANRLLARLRDPFTVRGIENYISACIGIALFPDHGQDPDALMQNADAAMYAVKSGGRNGISVYSPEMTLETRRRWEIETDLHRAIERREFELHYQPQVDMRTGRVVAAEALIRWNRGGTLVPPNDFIPVAQDCGLVIPIGEWALEEAARQVRAWIDAGLPALRVAVNISSSHFERADLVGATRHAIQAAGIDPRLLEIEITESVLMQDVGQTMDALVELTQLGVHLSVDDFGTGYSSLAYLKRFPLHTLKIDRSFVRDLVAGVDNEAIVAAIIAMARTLGLNTIAEGVETRQQAERLVAAGCTIAQGYLYGRPQPAGDLSHVLARGGPLGEPITAAEVTDSRAYVRGRG